MTITTDQVSQSVAAAATTAGFQYDGVDIELDQGQIVIKIHRKIGGILRTSGVTSGGKNIDHVAKISVQRAAEYWDKAEREYAEDVAVNNGAQPTSAPGTRMKPLGAWMET